MDSWYKRLLVELYYRKKTLMTLRWFINYNVGLQLNGFYPCKNYYVVRKQNVWITTLCIWWSIASITLNFFSSQIYYTDLETCMP